LACFAGSGGVFCASGNTFDKDYNRSPLDKKGVKALPTDLGKSFGIDWRGKPPQMLETDHPVWYRFLARYGQYFVALYYNCLLGGPFLTPEQERDPLQKMWRRNTAKRADAIAELENEVWIIEVADYPGLRAVGQLEVYQTLWIEDPKIMKPERLVLVCERIDEDLGAACAQRGIQIYLI